MAIHVTTANVSAEEVNAMLGAQGLTPDGVKAPAEVPPAKTEPAVPSVPPTAAGEPPSAAPAGESAAPSEGAEKTPQAGTQEEGKAPPAAEPPNPAKVARANFESRQVKLKKQIDALQTDLELERGSKAGLERKLEELQAELEKLKPAEAKTDAVTPPALVRPKRPTKADFDYDDDRYEAALDEHEVKLDEYMKAVAKQESEKSTREAREAEEKRQREEAATAEEREYQARFNKGRQEIADWDEVIESAPELEVTEVTQGFIRQSEIPADLVHHFLQNSEELHRIEKLDPLRRVRALTTVELKLEEQRKARSGGQPVAAAPVVETPPTPATPPAPAPAQPISTRPTRVDEPITPVGGRAPAVGQRLSQAVTGKDYLRLRLAGVKDI